jgi:hypothetical protein
MCSFTSKTCKLSSAICLLEFETFTFFAEVSHHKVKIISLKCDNSVLVFASELLTAEHSVKTKSCLNPKGEFFSFRIRKENGTPGVPALTFCFFAVSRP